MFSFMANKPKGHFYKNFQGFTYCSVFKVRCCCFSSNVLYHITLFPVCQQLFYFFQLLFRSLTPSLEASIIISNGFQKVNHFFHFFSSFFSVKIRHQNGVVYPVSDHKIHHSVLKGPGRQSGPRCLLPVNCSHPA